MIYKIFLTIIGLPISILFIPLGWCIIIMEICIFSAPEEYWVKDQKDIKSFLFPPYTLIKNVWGSK